MYHNHDCLEIHQLCNELRIFIASARWHSLSRDLVSYFHTSQFQSECFIYLTVCYMLWIRQIQL